MSYKIKRLLWVMLMLTVSTCTVAEEKMAQPLIPSLKEAIGKGEMLWDDTELSTNGKKCTTCHANGTLLKFDKPFPKKIEMAGGILSLSAMINFCLEKPMAGKPFDTSSPELVAMVAYHELLANCVKEKKK